MHSINLTCKFQEHLFDVSDLQDREPALISKCGTLEVTFNYSAIRAKMTVKVGTARDIPTKERGGASNVQVSHLSVFLFHHISIDSIPTRF